LQNISDIGPLFILDVEDLIGQKLYDDALELCLEGLKAYPEYGTAHLLLAQIHELKGDSDTAEQTVASISDRFLSNRALQNYTVGAVFEMQFSSQPISPVIEEDIPSNDVADLIETSVEAHIPEPLLESKELEHEQVIESTASDYSDPLDILEPTPEEIADDFHSIEEEVALEEQTLPDLALSNEEMEEELNNLAQQSAIEEESQAYNTDNQFITQFPADRLDLIPGMEFINDPPAKYDRRSHFSTSDLNEMPDFNLDGIISKQADLTTDITSFDTPIPNEFDLLANKLSGVKMQRFDEDIEDAPEYEADSIAPIAITETMANILVMQGSYKQAISAFQSLAERFPYKADIYLKRVSELEIEMEEKK
jgi:tetratricopeptide (TPR) repeat protein